MREQAGAEVFDLVESIRRTAIRYRMDHDAPSLERLERTLGRLGAAHATNVVRAFSYFHHLANAAEDLHARRAQPGEGTIAQAFERLRAAHVATRKIVAFFERARVEPVLTAHPTEVQRKSTLDRHRAVIDLLAARGVKAAGDIEKALRREILLMWKTNELRLSKPTVADEIENGLAYFRSTFLEAIPRLYAEIEDGLGSGTRLAPFLRVASWIGGDRDGNPHVTAEVTGTAPERQASVALRRTISPRSTRWAPSCRCRRRYAATPPELQALAARSPDRGTSRDEGGVPARAGRHLRARGVDRAETLEVERKRHARAGLGAGASVQRVRPTWAADLGVDRERATPTTAQSLASGRTAAQSDTGCRTSSASTSAPLDLRQHSGVHERVVSRAARAGDGHAAGTRILAEPERQALLLRGAGPRRGR